jgi:phospholipid-binding lipoprotein MlaA
MMLLAAGCATFPDDPEERAEVVALNDPFEPANRMMFAINEAVDVVLLRPAAVLYRDFMPGPAKELVFNFVRNLTLPLTIVNDVLQGEWDRADIAAKRLFVNTIAGFGGIADAATGIGLPHHKEDFGQTLATYQVVPGPYVVLPLLGPSSTRHAFGRVIDFAIDPLTYLLASAPIESSLTNRGLSVVDQRYQLLAPLDEVKQSSFDYYASLRSLYRQRRAFAIRNQGEDNASTAMRN